MVWKLRVDAKVDAVDVELSFYYFRDVQRMVVGSSTASMLRPFVPGDVQLTFNIGFTVVFQRSRGFCSGNFYTKKRKMRLQ